jgi:3-oxoadipate enol-lactonase
MADGFRGLSDIRHLSAFITGESNGSPVVLLHAIATNARIWSLQQPVWSSHHRCIALDLGGHGKSSPASVQPQLCDYARQVAVTLRGLGVDRAIVVGLSFGGMVAQSLALNHPDQVSALVLAQTSARTTPAVRAAWQSRIEAVLRDGMKSQITPTLMRWFTEAFRSSAPLSVGWIADMIQSTLPEGYCDAAGAIMKLDDLDRLSEISVPTLVIAGKCDAAVPLEATEAMIERLPRSRLAVLSGSHLANVESAREFTETVGAFLADPTQGLP